MVFKYGGDTTLHLKPSRGNNSESMKVELSFLYAIHRHDLFYIAVKYHDYIPKGIQVIQRTRNCIKKHLRGDNSKCIKARALILYAINRHDLFYITVKYHQTIPNSFQVKKRTRNGRIPGSSLYPLNISIGE